MSQPESTADAGIPTSDLPYAIRVLVQNKKADSAIRYLLAEKEKQEVDSLSRDERDWHGPGERSEAIGRIRWRYKDASDLKEMAQLCVESEVATLAEKLLPVCLTGIHGGCPPLWAAKRAFSEAEEFIAERNARALAIRTANVDSLLDPHDNQPKGE